MTKGDYAIGVRMDGTGNTLTIDKGVTVASNGKEGSGIAVTWGMGHELNVNGTVEATGESGKALRFDFGDNVIGNDNGYMGSYFMLMKPQDDGKAKNENPTVFLEALVHEVNISGTVKGKEAAIYMSPNAFVKNINILEGAQISGDITNEWKHVTDEVSDTSWVQLYNSKGANLTLDAYCPDLVTSINVAVGKDNVFTYDNDITGKDNTS